MAATGDVFLAVPSMHSVMVFTPDGAFKAAMTQPCANKIAVDESGVYVASFGQDADMGDGSTCSGAVVKYSVSGTQLWNVTPDPSDLPEVESIGSNGTTVFLLASRWYSSSTSTVVRLDAMDGSVAGPVWSLPFPSRGLAAHEDRLYVHNYTNQSLLNLDPTTGAVTGVFAAPGVYAESAPAVDRTGTVLYQDPWKVHFYSPTGRLLAQRPQLMGLDWYHQMAVSPAGRFYGVASGNPGVVFEDLAGLAELTLNKSGDSDGRVLTGSPVTLTAAATVQPLDTIQRFDWDLDGDGSFEASTPDSVTSTTWAAPGPRTVGVRVTTTLGLTRTATTPVVVTPSPPAGAVGVSLNRGAAFTSSKAVTLRAVWPPFATGMRVSNDGGFSTSTAIALAEEQPWILDDTIAGQFTKNVYVRFEGPGINTTQTFSDDIIFDNTAPVVSSVSAQPAAGSPSLRAASLVAAKKKTRTYLVKTKAKDDRSGVGSIQVNVTKSAKKAQTLTFAKKVKVKVTSSKAPDVLWIRVQDRAGNWSKWKKAPVR